jgi:predicted dehydrogenase
MPKIRVGMIRCDCHALYYACIMAEHDPFVLRQPVPREQILRTVHGWQRGGVFKYFYTLFGNPEKMTVDAVDGFEVVKLWDQNRTNAQMIQRILLGRPTICETLDEVTDDVDLVFISDCNGDGSDHLELARPGLLKGIATFADKPFAFSSVDMLDMMRIAKEHDAPLMSLSILRMLPAVNTFMQRRHELGDLQFATIQGGGDSMAGIVHTTALAQNMFGPGVESVRCMGEGPPTSIRLHFAKGSGGPPWGVMINTDTGDTPNCALYASCYGTKGTIHSPPLDDWEFPHGSVEITRLVKQMVTEKKSPMPDEQMVEIIAAIDAARRSLEQGGRLVSVLGTIREAEAQLAARPRSQGVTLKPLLVPPGIERPDAPVQFVPV